MLISTHPLCKLTSYNFTGTHTTPELCAGVVKATGIYPKNPAQHSADIKMLESVSELSQAFLNPRTSSPKEIECIRVDRANDEGPFHEEVQLWWTERHFKRPTIATIISARSSHLNRVELQNGCLSLGHAKLFIPSTIGGSCTDLNSTRENTDAIKLPHNMDLATNECTLVESMEVHVVRLLYNYIKELHQRNRKSEHTCLYI